jgi:hypothetical protein
MRHAGLLATAFAALLLLAGCESTQSRSARLSKQSKTSLDRKGLTVIKENPRVKVDKGVVLHDRFGSAAVVEVQNLSSEAQVRVPISIAVTDTSGKPVFRNDGAGIEEALTHIAVLPAKGRVAWVNNQVNVDAPRSVEAKVGVSDAKAPAQIPRMAISGVHYDQDPDGVIVRGKVQNTSKILQRNLTIFIVARRGGRIVAAGRARVEKVKPGKTAKFTSFFVGNPKGAKLTLFAPPSVLN